MESKREKCRNCMYFMPGTIAGEELGGSEVMGECVNSESDYERRTVDAAFWCEAHEARNE